MKTQAQVPHSLRLPERGLEGQPAAQLTTGGLSPSPRQRPARYSADFLSLEEQLRVGWGRAVPFLWFR